MKPLLAIAVSAILLSLSACAPPPASAGGFHSPDPASRLYAIQHAGEAGDRDAVPYLVESLESDDPAERMWAIHALEKLTGERKGYNPYNSLLDREQAVQRWRAWLESEAAP